MASKIRSGDTVQVIVGQGRRQAGQGPARRAEEEPGVRRGPQHRQAPPAPALAQGHAARRQGRRRDREGGPDPHLQRDGRRPEGRTSRRACGIERAADGARERVAVRSGTKLEERLMAARLKERYESEIKPAADRAVRLHERDAGAAAGEDHRSTWASARRSRTRKLLDAAAEQLATIAGPEAGRPPRAQVDRELQAARGHAGGRRWRRCAASACGRCSTASSRSRSRGSATSAASTRARSTAAATTRWACASRSSFRRSTTTRSTRCAASTSRSRRRPRPTRRRFELLRLLGHAVPPRRRRAARPRLQMRQQQQEADAEARGRGAGRASSSQAEAPARSPRPEEDRRTPARPARSPAAERRADPRSRKSE